VPELKFELREKKSKRDIDEEEKSRLLPSQRESILYSQDVYRHLTNDEC